MPEIKQVRGMKSIRRIHVNLTIEEVLKVCTKLKVNDKVLLMDESVIPRLPIYNKN
jgi:hypothetical protein